MRSWIDPCIQPLTVPSLITGIDPTKIWLIKSEDRFSREVLRQATVYLHEYKKPLIWFFARYCCFEVDSKPITAVPFHRSIATGSRLSITDVLAALVPNEAGRAKRGERVVCSLVQWQVGSIPVFGSKWNFLLLPFCCLQPPEREGTGIHLKTGLTSSW